VEGDASAVGVGDMVVVTGTFRLIDGQAVRLLELQDPLLHVGLEDFRFQISDLGFGIWDLGFGIWK
ncbi:MAG: hypothetical protein ABFD16_13025, partial [Thermoguttaceae bacterium]